MSNSRSLYDISAELQESGASSSRLDLNTEALFNRYLDNQSTLFRCHVQQSMDQFRSELEAMMANNVTAMNTRVDALANLAMQQSSNHSDEDTDIDEGSIPMPANRNAQIGEIHRLVKERWNITSSGARRDDRQSKNVSKRLTAFTNCLIGNTDTSLYRDGVKQWSKLNTKTQEIMMKALETLAKRQLNVKLAECINHWGARELLSKGHSNFSRKSRAKKARTATVAATATATATATAPVATATATATAVDTTSSPFVE
jgi:hypothetical protein